MGVVDYYGIGVVALVLFIGVVGCGFVNFDVVVVDGIYVFVCDLEWIFMVL